MLSALGKWISRLRWKEQNVHVCELIVKLNKSGEPRITAKCLELILKEVMWGGTLGDFEWECDIGKQ